METKSSCDVLNIRDNSSLEPDIMKIYRKQLNKCSNDQGKNNRGIRQGKPSTINRPSDSKWKQQKLAAWQPILKPINVIVVFYLIGVICLSLGVFMFHTNEKVQEYVFDYTDCNSIIDPEVSCSNYWKLKWQSCKCRIDFKLSKKLQAPVFIYYSLEGFYQNHRRYVSSVDYYQLGGKERSLQAIRSNCFPYSDVDGRIIAPCGAIANSLFTDKFKILLRNETDGQYKRINIKQKEISWPFDRGHLFKNPLKGLESFAKPTNWSINFNQEYQENGGFENEHFIVWMRVAAFPIFKKLWGRIDVESLLTDEQALPEGSYQLQIDYEYVTVFDNLRIAKKIIISNMSWMGGKNYFLPIVYMVTGILCLVTASAFIVLTFYTQRKYTFNQGHSLTILKPGSKHNRQPIYQSTCESKVRILQSENELVPTSTRL